MSAGRYAESAARAAFRAALKDRVGSTNLVVAGLSLLGYEPHDARLHRPD